MQAIQRRAGHASSFGVWRIPSTYLAAFKSVPNSSGPPSPVQQHPFHMLNTQSLLRLLFFCKFLKATISSHFLRNCVAINQCFFEYLARTMICNRPRSLARPGLGNKVNQGTMTLHNKQCLMVPRQCGSIGSHVHSHLPVMLRRENLQFS
jgi:hypothetical protein